MDSIRITDTVMVSNAGHTAALLDGYGPYDSGAWTVSWCAGRRFDRNDAITALTVAGFVKAGVTDESHKQWPIVKSFAAELGMDPHEAVRLVRGETL